MENNNIKKEENSVERNVNEVNGGTKKSNNNVGKSVLIVIVLVLVLIVGILAGVFIAGNRKDDTDNVQNKTTEVTEKKEENKAGKKVDANKEWVYDADYISKKKDIVKTSDTYHITVKASEEIKLPYININSNDANKVNEEIKALAEKAYTDFGKPATITDAKTNKQYTSDDSFEFTRYSYKNYVNNNVLSIVIQKVSAMVPGDGTTSYITYNFDLETLKLVEAKDVLQQYGFKSQSDFNDKLKIEIKNLEVRGEAVSVDFSKWDEKRFFIKDGRINVVVPGLAMGESIVEVNPNAVANTNEKENTAKETNTQKQDNTSKETNTQNKENTTSQAKITKQLSPSGWAGSSMQEIRLYDNGEVYHVTYNGEGKTENNVISSELIAKNAESIEEKINGQVVEGIVVKGKNVNKVKENVPAWITFENN